MCLHIRGVGEWTNRLYTYFEKEKDQMYRGKVGNFSQNECANDGDNLTTDTEIEVSLLAISELISLIHFNVSTLQTIDYMQNDV